MEVVGPFAEGAELVPSERQGGWALQRETEKVVGAAAWASSCLLGPSAPGGGAPSAREISG